MQCAGLIFTHQTGVDDYELGVGCFRSAGQRYAVGLLGRGQPKSVHCEVVRNLDRTVIVAAVDAERQLAWAVFAFSEWARFRVQLDRPDCADVDAGMHIQCGSRVIVGFNELLGGDAGHVG